MGRPSDDRMASHARSHRSGRYYWCCHFPARPLKQYQLLWTTVRPIRSSSSATSNKLRCSSFKFHCSDNRWQLQWLWRLLLKRWTTGTVVVSLITACAEDRPFRMVFMDNTMMDMHGSEAATRCMRQNSFGGIIVGVTGNNNVMPMDITEEYTYSSRGKSSSLNL